MTATPEEFLREGFLVDPEPLSPSLFLDLPPTPHSHADGEDPVNSDDLVLPYISRMLMEEDIDDKFFYQYPDQPALLTAQQPYAQILSDTTTTTTSSDSATNNTTNSGNSTGLSPSDSATNNTTNSGNSTGFSPSSSSPDAPASANPTWPYDPIELSQLLQSPPYLDMRIGLADDVDNLFLPGDVAPSSGFQQSPALDKGAADDGNPSFAGAGQNGGTTGIQSSALLNDTDEQEVTITTSSSDSATNNTTNSGNSTGLSPSSSSPDAPASANPTWPYDPIELSQLLQSPPYLDMRIGLADDVDNLFLPGDVTPSAGFQQSPALDKGVADDGNPSFAGAGQNGGTTGIQISALLNDTDEQEVEAKTIISLPDGDGDQGALASAFFNGQTGSNMDMLNLAFLKGMEEAKKFLPTNNNLLIDLEATSEKFLPRDSKLVSGFTAGRVKEEEVVDGMPMFGGGTGNGRGRKNRHDWDDLEADTGRNSKLLMPELEETGAREMFDEIMLRGFEICMKGMEDLRIAMGSEAEKNIRKGTAKAARGSRGTSKVVDLHTLLIHCAQSVATGDRRSANELLKQIKQHSSPRGDTTQRLAHCFAEGLEARLAGTGSQVYRSLVAKRTSVVEFLKAYKLYMAACCFKKVNFIFSIKTIYNAVAGRSRLHIVDYGVQYGFQWPGLLQLLAAREGGPPEVRLTGIDLPQPGFRPAFQIEETGRRLSNCAREFGVPFKFHNIAAKWETIRAEDLNIDPDEVLVVNSQCGFNNLMDESVVLDSPSPRDVVLSNIRKMRPNVFIQCVVNGTYGAPFFVTRFREALFFYSAHFDVLDATIPRECDERLLIERDIFGRCALNVIACEGADRVDRPETYKQWQVRNHRAGLRQLQLNPEVVQVARNKVKNHYHKDFVIDVDHRWLLQGWKGRVLYAMSTWVADDNKSIF